MSEARLKGAAIGFVIGMITGLQMCQSCHSGSVAEADFWFGLFIGLPCAIIGALVAKDKSLPLEDKSLLLEDKSLPLGEKSRVNREYYFVDGNRTLGPFKFDELVNHKISSTTPFWYEGLTTWEPGSKLAELAFLFNVPPPLPINNIPPPAPNEDKKNNIA